MLTETVQRYTQGRDTYRPAGEPIRTSEYDVEAIASDAIAKRFVLANHYSGSYPAARRRFGLYHRAELVGVAVFSVPQNERTFDCLPGATSENLELGRFVLVDEVPANGESWFLARCFERLRAEGFVGVVSFSDPTPRTSSTGDTIHGGHVGTIYQATNARYLGTSKPETRRLLPNGELIPGRALTKIRNRRRGVEYASAVLVAHGADPLEDDDDARAWVARWVGELTTPLRHPGNHKYAWALERRGRRHLPASRPYPKIELAA